MINNVIAAASTSSGEAPTRRVAPSRSSATTVRRARTARQSNVVVPIVVPEVEIQIANTGENEGGNPTTPRTPENEQNNVQVVDLITPAVQPQIPVVRARRPLEVDLTCDLDDEVFVVLEDIVNPSRRTNLSDLPIMLGSSPPRTRVLGPRNLRSTFTSRSVSTENPVVFQAPPASAPPTVQEGGSHGIHCPICLDSLSQVKEANQQMHSTICGHLFCGPCIKRLIGTTQQCPSCRQKLDIRKIHPIFI
ncbi:hypothetical protein DAPPUDRAFT_304913 [Daphnia pulex]|uniref:RING-type domain-containing protein n=1 Tax=Daphnia pulex TaxID=6669 RepID=E9GMY1_DAPPU|nr:hypothetical protein DAPPUDRAFT_304913 [Daphnia pulex]|eukprot:EFX79211.1 hypothetical protein DAPPUDRAFT_304913 [Daphnia pulex]